MISDFKRDAAGYYIEKDPNDVLDYVVDWSLFLNGDTISASVWVIPGGITQGTASNTTTTATTILSGGTAGSTYTVANRITTAGGKTAERSFRVVVKDL